MKVVRILLIFFGTLKGRWILTSHDAIDGHHIKDFGHSVAQDKSLVLDGQVAPGKRVATQQHSRN